MKFLLMSFLLAVNSVNAGSKITMHYDHAEPLTERIANKYVRCFYAEPILYGGGLTTSIIVEGGSSLFNNCPRTIYVDPVAGTWSEYP